jgi:hypothetical protein
MALSTEQEWLYRQTFDIWRRATTGLTRGADKGITGAAGYVRVAATVPGHLSAGKGMSVPTEGAGRTDYDIVQTADSITFGADVDVRDGDVVKHTTPGHASAGDFWQVQGEPRRSNPIEGLYPGKRVVVAARLPKPPTGVS